MRAVKTIADEAGIHIGIKRFAVINQVAAVALNATIDCDAFADAHSSDSHYDKKSFVGLAVCLCYLTVPRLVVFTNVVVLLLIDFPQWRPSGESICAECYSTGKTNLPGSRRERQMLRSFARMAPEMYQYSNKKEMSLQFAEDIRHVHNPESASKRRRPASNDGGRAKSGAPARLWHKELDELLDVSLTRDDSGKFTFHGLREIEEFDMDNSDLDAIFGV